jgi:hypothetical protein
MLQCPFSLLQLPDRVAIYWYSSDQDFLHTVEAKIIHSKVHPSKMCYNPLKSVLHLT